MNLSPTKLGTTVHALDLVKIEVFDLRAVVREGKAVK
jgi:hypothetical protein